MKVFTLTLLACVVVAVSPLHAMAQSSLVTEILRASGDERSTYAGRDLGLYNPPRDHGQSKLAAALGLAELFAREEILRPDISIWGIEFSHPYARWCWAQDHAQSETLPLLEWTYPDIRANAWARFEDERISFNETSPGPTNWIDRGPLDNLFAGNTAWRDSTLPVPPGAQQRWRPLAWQEQAMWSRKPRIHTYEFDRSRFTDPWKPKPEIGRIECTNLAVVVSRFEFSDSLTGDSARGVEVMAALNFGKTIYPIPVIVDFDCFDELVKEIERLEKITVASSIGSEYRVPGGLSLRVQYILDGGPLAPHLIFYVERGMMPVPLSSSQLHELRELILRARNELEQRAKTK